MLINTLLSDDILTLNTELMFSVTNAGRDDGILVHKYRLNYTLICHISLQIASIARKTDEAIIIMRVAELSHLRNSLICRALSIARVAGANLR